MPELVFRLGRASVELSRAGTVVSVRHDGEPGTSYLASAGEVELSAAGPPRSWSPAQIAADADEVEVTRHAGPLRLVVRHSFSAGWAVRLVLANEADTEVVLDDVLVGWRPGAGHHVWALAAGSVGSVAVFAAGGTGPLLGGTLRAGVLERVSEQGLHLGRLVLGPRSRFVEQWHWDFHPDPRSFDRRLPATVPRRLDVTVGEVVVVPADEDEAVVADPDLQTVAAGDALELSAAVAGRYRVELRSARGSTAYELAVADPEEVLMAQAAAAALQQPRTGSGVVPLAGVDAALVVQLALVRGADVDPDAAEEALDLFTARLPEHDRLDPRTIGYLCAEHERTADPELLDRATRAVLAAWQPEPGLGLAATQLCLARLLGGLSVTAVVSHLHRLAAEAVVGAGPSSTGAVAEQAALLELEVVTLPRTSSEPRPASRTGERAVVVARTAALGTWLGAGLRGRAVPPLPVEELAHLVAVLALLPEPVSVELQHRWGCTAHELARRGQTEVLTRLAGRPAGPAHGWLALASRPG